MKRALLLAMTALGCIGSDIPEPCRAFCAARQEHIRRCGSQALIEETMSECLADAATSPERCPTDETLGGWRNAACR